VALSAQQVEARKRGVGGSEILAALGKDPRCSRVELYKRKVGELPELDFSKDQRVQCGQRFEPVIRDMCAERLNTEIIVPTDTLFHPGAPLVGNPDGLMPALKKGLEIKMCDKFLADEFGEEETDQVPVRYLVQCQAYMSLTGYGAWVLAVLIGGNDLRFYEIESNKEIEAAVLAGVTEFWSHVEKRNPPTPQTPEEVKIRWPKDLGTTAIATPEIVEACSRLRVAKDAVKTATWEEDLAAAHIKSFMQEDANLVDADGTVLATWRTAKPSTKFNDKKFAIDDPVTHKKYTYEQPGSRRFLLK
jgi:predicted phage-related endonuclease